MKNKSWLDTIKKYIPTWLFHSIIIYLPFSQYNYIQNFEEKKLFQHFANLIKIRSTHLLPILDLIIPPLPEGGGRYTVLPLSVRPSKIFFVTFFSATIDGRNLIFRSVFINNSVFNLHFMKVSTEIDNNFGYEKITQLVDNIPLICQVRTCVLSRS